MTFKRMNHKAVLDAPDVELTPSDMQDLVGSSVRKLSLEQQHSVELCCDRSIKIVGVTGGAGTGKTTVLGTAYRELIESGARVGLAAPTGRAAKRVEELTGIKAKTVHRWLEFPQPDEFSDEPNEPRRNSQSPLDLDVLIVDEYSMVSPILHTQIMQALGKRCVIRCFGDNNQLPPVESDGSSAPFFMILDKFPKVELTFNYRSDDAIVNNAQRILRRSLPLPNDRFHIMYTGNPIGTLLEFVKSERIFAKESHQIIMPTRKGKYGTIRTNPSLQVRFNPRGPMLKIDRFDDSEAQLGVRQGDKFLWIKNDYKLELFNGEIGTIDMVDEDSGELGIRTAERSLIVPPRLKTYSPYHGTVIDYDPRKQIELGYAITTHKSQGSEFHTVIYVICRGHMYLLNRRNFYTAITRAKHHVIIIADRAAMGMAMRAYNG